MSFVGLIIDPCSYYYIISISHFFYYVVCQIVLCLLYQFLFLGTRLIIVDIRHKYRSKKVMNFKNIKLFVNDVFVIFLRKVIVQNSNSCI